MPRRQTSVADSKYSAKAEIDECCKNLKRLREQLKDVAAQVEAAAGTGDVCSKESSLGLSCTSLKCRVKKCSLAVEKLKRHVRPPREMFYIGDGDAAADHHRSLLRGSPQRHYIGDVPTPWRSANAD